MWVLAAGTWKLTTAAKTTSLEFEDTMEVSRIVGS